MLKLAAAISRSIKAPIHDSTSCHPPKAPYQPAAIPPRHHINQRPFPKAPSISTSCHPPKAPYQPAAIPPRHHINQLPSPQGTISTRPSPQGINQLPFPKAPYQPAAIPPRHHINQRPFPKAPYQPPSLSKDANKELRKLSTSSHTQQTGSTDTDH